MYQAMRFTDSSGSSTVRLIVPCSESRLSVNDRFAYARLLSATDVTVVSQDTVIIDSNLPLFN